MSTDPKLHVKDLTLQKLKNFPLHYDANSPIEIAEHLQSMSAEARYILFNGLSEELSCTVFEYLPPNIQIEILRQLPSHRVAMLLNFLAPDDRTKLLQELSPDLINQLLKYLPPKERALSVKLLGYPEDSVGRLMTPDYITVKLDWTIKQSLDHIREKGKDSETLNVIYSVDDNGVLLDDYRIRQFLLAPLDAKLRALSDFKFISLNVNENVEKAINAFRKYDRVALPVIDAKGILLGIVTVDDILEQSTQENTEDIQKIGGVGALKTSYMETPFFTLMRKRAGWLVILFIGEMLTASALGYFEDEIAKAVVLALFVPLVISSGGNAGSQSSALIIRALALGEVTLRDWWKIMRREIYSGVFLGVILGSIGFFRITLWSAFSNIYGAHWILLGMTVFCTLIGVVLWGTLAGALLPLVMQRLGFDPATSSTPFIATLVDVTGIIIYFTVALIILTGTLL